MGLTAQKSLDLEGADLDDLFKEDKKLWTSMAKQAYGYVADFVKEADEPVRPDDLIPVLVPVLEITEKLRIFLAENGLNQKYWYTWFGELIVDRVWKELNKKTVTKGKGGGSN